MIAAFDRLADYFVALKELRAENDPARQRAIAAVLGFVLETEETPKTIVAPRPPTPLVDKPIEMRGGRARESFDPATFRPESRRVRSQKTTTLSYTVTPIPAARRSRPEWLDHVTALPPPPGKPAVPPSPAPLLAMRWSRAVLSTAMSVDTTTNAIDVDAIVRAVGRGIPLRRVPRRVMPTLSRGVQLLVDRGPGSAPFVADQDLLIQQIRVVAGDRVQVLRFDPSRKFIAGSGPRSRWKDYFGLTPPLPGVAVVLISDLGIASVPLETTAVPAEWREFVTRLRARGNCVIAFVPYAPRRWPAMLRRLLGIVPLDRRTSVQSVRRFLGRRVRRPVIA
jgi:hypothetical protein